MILHVLIATVTGRLQRHQQQVIAYLQEVATLVTPSTLMRWYHCLIAQKFDRSTRRR